MILFRKSKKKQSDAPIKKTFVQAPVCRSVDSINFQLRAGFERPFFQTYIQFFQSVAPLGDAIDIIASQFSSILPKVFNVKTKEFTDDHPMLELLENPNMNVPYCEFAESEASYFELTGNHYWIVTLSGIDGTPLELFSVPPQFINPRLDVNGLVESYNYTPQGQAITFFSKPQGKRIKYETIDGKAQLFLLKRFNPNAGAHYYLGLSKLHSMIYELMQYRLSSIHNASLLENGGRPGGMLTSEGDVMITPDQLSDLRAEWETVFSGAANAGRPIIASQMKWEDFTQSNRDMDFSELKQQVQEMIYNRLRVPLTLTNSKALSLANMEVAMTQLYDLAVLPLAIKVFGALTMNLMHLYKGRDDLILAFDPSTIPAIKDRNIQQIQEMASFNVMSDNEIRNRIDLPSYDGGDDIYKPSTLIPVDTADPVSSVNNDDDQGDDAGSGDDTMNGDNENGDS